MSDVKLPWFRVKCPACGHPVSARTIVSVQESQAEHERYHEAAQKVA